MEYLIGITVILVSVSFIKDWKKTIQGFKQAFKRFTLILFPLVAVLIIVSFILFFIPEKTITEYLSNGNKYIGALLALLFGSIPIRVTGRVIHSPAYWKLIMP